MTPDPDDGSRWERLAAAHGVGPGRERLLASPEVLASLAPEILADPGGFARLVEGLAGGRAEARRWTAGRGLAEAATPFVFDLAGGPAPNAAPDAARAAPALGLVEEGGAPDRDAADRGADPLVEHARRVGLAFRYRLLPGLPDGLTRVERFLVRNTRGAGARRTLTNLDEVAATAAGDAAAGLDRLGVSPLSFAVAARAVARALRRFMARHGLPERGELVVDVAGDARATPPGVSHLALAQGVASSTELDPGLGWAMLAWLVQAAPLRPLIFDGFLVRGSGVPLRLEPEPSPADIDRQWGSRPGNPAFR